MIDTAQKRQASLSTSVRGILPLPDGTSDAIDRGMMLGIYWIEDTSPSATFVMARRAYKSPGKHAYKPAGKAPYKP